MVDYPEGDEDPLDDEEDEEEDDEDPIGPEDLEE